MRKLVLGLSAFLMVVSCNINTSNTPKYFFRTIDEAMRYEPHSPNDSTPYIYCKYLKRDTVFDKNGKPIKETEKEMNDIVLTLGNDTIFLEIPIKIENATFDFYTCDKLFAKDGSEAKDVWEFVFKKLKSNIYYITTEKFPVISNEDGISLQYPPSIKITASDYNYKSNVSQYSYTNIINYSFDEVYLADKNDINMKIENGEKYYWVGDEHQKEKFINWLQFNSIFKN